MNRPDDIVLVAVPRSFAETKVRTLAELLQIHSAQSPEVRAVWEVEFGAYSRALEAAADAGERSVAIDAEVSAQRDAVSLRMMLLLAARLRLLADSPAFYNAEGKDPEGIADALMSARDTIERLIAKLLDARRK